MRDEVDSTDLRALDTSVLVHLLNEYLSDGLEPGSDAAPAMPEEISDDLVRHGVQAWGVLTKRAFSRFDAAGKLELCTGFKSLHYHSSGGLEFEYQVPGAPPRPAPAPAEDEDPWSDDNLIDDTLIPRSARRPPRPPPAGPEDAHPVVTARLADTSPGGYGVVWEGTIPESVKTGELRGESESCLIV